MSILQRPVLLLYKRSAYSYYKQLNLRKEISRFQQAHHAHLQTLATVEKTLRRHGIAYVKYARGEKIPYKSSNLVITIGGDGTFLEAARNIDNQLILGVNSAPLSSRGKLCVATADNFEKILKKVIGKQIKIDLWQRLYIKLDGYSRPLECLNDILVCHTNPAAVSRYYIKIGNIQEEQRSSGLWIATPAGSTGAMRSAGGHVLKITDKKLQYKPRELYQGKGIPVYRLKGGVLRENPLIIVTSLMREGMVFADGTHVPLKFPFNATLRVSLSPNPVRALQA